LFKKIIRLTLLLGFISATRLFAAQNPDELYRKGRFSEAAKAYTQLDMDHPKDIRYRYNRGCAQVMGSDYKGAMAAFSSVLKRTKDDGMRFKASYNMGVTSFKQGDFASASEHFKDSIKYNPESEEAKYNLELSLRELDKQKKKKEKNQAKKKGDKNNRKGPSKSKKQEEQKGKEQDKKSKKGAPDKNPSKKQDNKGKEDKKGKDNKKEQNGNKKPEKGKQGEPDQDSNTARESPKDLKGKLSLKNKLHPEKDKGQNKTEEQPGVMLDRKKAEALLDNLKEDRSRFFSFQVPQNKRNVPSGKDW